MSSIVLWIFASWLIADLLSGFWHWLEDRYFEEEWPILGKYVAKPNTLHHAQPSAFLHQGYWSRNWTTILPASIAACIVVFFLSPWALLPLLFVSQANEVHAWAHQRCPRFIRVLQESGVLQSPQHHGQHHRAPFDCKYCVMSNWLNPILDYAGFWFCLEWILAMVFRIRPKPESKSP